MDEQITAEVLIAWFTIQIISYDYKSFRLHRWIEPLPNVLLTLYIIGGNSDNFRRTGEKYAYTREQ